MARRDWKRGAALLAQCHQGETWLRTPGADDRDIQGACPYCLTSTHADCWLIGAWSTYWNGYIPRRIAIGRGGYWVEIDGCGELFLRITDPRDHRNGVQALDGPEPAVKGFSETGRLPFLADRRA